ncbi:phage tail tube protein [Iamia majanohamensis]|uniref:Phage tail tube protein n=1 Tax=Iamia majanohamensis TaxID=467976 RepID=A0AAE9Y706_9ACTN|nr:phage tail tube protein [Iamia majanohamensis]WCO67875.1 phage tail tube protein [Iamia majanohamensis]
MAGNARFLFAKESTYGTAPASGWRQIEVATDDHKARPLDDSLTYRGIAPARGAPSVASVRVNDFMGGEGTIDVPAMANSQGLFWRAAASTSASAVVSGGTDAYEQVYEFDGTSAPTGTSLSTEVYRDRRDGTLDAYTFTGGKVTQVDISQDTSGHVMLKFAMDYLDAQRQGSLPSRSETTPDPGFLYAWPDATITLTPDGGSDADECLQSFELSLPLGLDLEDWCIKSGTPRHEPTRKETPAPTGAVNWKYQAPTYYDAFKAGTIFTLSAYWEGPTAIEDTTYPSLKIDVPAIRFTGEDPQVSVDNPTMQNLPFQVLDNDTDPPVTVTIITSDTAA